MPLLLTAANFNHYFLLMPALTRGDKKACGSEVVRLGSREAISKLRVLDVF